MKYIITENKLNNIIFKYLDMKYGAIEQKKGRYSDIVFTFPGEEYGVLGWNKSGDLYVCYELRYEISNLFGIENVNPLRVIGKWVEGKYNLKVTNTYSQLNNMQYLVEGIYKVNSKDKMKYIITESKINSTIYNFIDNLFASEDGNPKIYKLVSIDEDGGSLIDSYDFVNDDYYSDEGSEYLFNWTGKEYFKTVYSQGDITKYEYERMASETPMVSILKTQAKEELNNFFGDLWKPVFKQWFKDKTGLDYKNLNQ